MADSKISALSELTSVATGDIIPVVDVSDTTQAVTGTTKKITKANLTTGLAASGANSDITSLSGLTTALSVAQGGTGSTTASDARTALGLAIGSNVQAYDAQLADVAGLTPTDNGVVIGNGTNFVVESGATLKTSLGLTIGSDVQAYNATLAAVAGGTYTGDDSIATVGTVTAGNVDAVVSAANTTTAGKVELAIASELNTGTDADRAVTPDALAGSNYGKEVAIIPLFAPGTDAAIGDGKAYLPIDEKLNGWNLVSVFAWNATAGTTGTQDIQIHNVTDAVDMLSTKLTIDSTEQSSSTAATAAVIDGTKDDVATNDILRIDVDAVQTTKGKGTIVTLGFQLP